MWGMRMQVVISGRRAEEWRMRESEKICKQYSGWYLDVGSYSGLGTLNVTLDAPLEAACNS